MQDRPSAEELLETVADFLHNEVLPVTQGPVQHQVRVAANLCRILKRERELGEEQEAEERRLLTSVLGLCDPPPPVLELNEALVEALHRGEDPALERRAWQALVKIARGKLAVAKPGYDEYDFTPELEA